VCGDASKGATGITSSLKGCSMKPIPIEAMKEKQFKKIVAAKGCSYALVF